MGKTIWRLVIMYQGKRDKYGDENMEELECVILVKEFNELKIGTRGTIVLKYTENDYEVEFFDCNGETIGVYTIGKEYLKLEK
jgi:hypothetical protein